MNVTVLSEKSSGNLENSLCQDAGVHVEKHVC